MGKKIASNGNNVKNDTSYLLSSIANSEHLQRSIKEGQKGKVIKLTLNDIWENKEPISHYTK